MRETDVRETDVPEADGARAQFAVFVVLGLLAIGATVGVAVGLAEHSLWLGAATGVGSFLASGVLLWFLFGPAKRATMLLLEPLLRSVDLAFTFITGVFRR